MLIFASEDIGNADPRALVVAIAADAAFRRMGMPEGIYPLAHACLYLASAPKSNACNAAWHRAKALIDEHGALPVPMKLRNAVTKLMKDEGYGAGYKYAHDYEDGVVPGETYLPDELGARSSTSRPIAGRRRHARAARRPSRSPREVNGTPREGEGETERSSAPSEAWGKGKLNDQKLFVAAHCAT